jgi:hypothetical protein
MTRRRGPQVYDDPSNPDKKLNVSANLEAKLEFMLVTFLWEILDVFT